MKFIFILIKLVFLLNEKNNAINSQNTGYLSIFLINFFNLFSFILIKVIYVN